MVKSEKKYGEWYFLAIIVAIFVTAVLVKPEALMPTLTFFFSIIKKIFWILILVFLLMAATNYFVSPKKIAKYLGKQSGIKGWLLAIVGGIISTGPIYMWYPWLNDLQKKGMKTSLIAAFLYNRAIKIALLPLMILYFGLAYTIILTFVMIIASIAQGIVVEKIMEVKK